MVSLMVNMGTLFFMDLTLDLECPLHDNVLQIAKSSKKLFYINTKGPNQRDNLLILNSNNWRTYLQFSTKAFFQ